MKKKTSYDSFFIENDEILLDEGISHHFSLTSIESERENRVYNRQIWCIFSHIQTQTYKEWTQLLYILTNTFEEYFVFDFFCFWGWGNILYSNNCKLIWQSIFKFRRENIHEIEKKQKFYVRHSEWIYVKRKNSIWITVSTIFLSVFI